MMLFHPLKNKIFLRLLLIFVGVVFGSGCRTTQESNKTEVESLIKNLVNTPLSNKEYPILIDSLYKISLKKNYTPGIIKSFSLKGNYFLEKANYTEALNNFQAAVRYGKSSNNIFELGENYNNVGRTYFRVKDREKAIDAFKQAVIYRTQSKDSTGLGSSLNNVGFLYWQTSEYDSAIAYFERALEIRKKLSNKEFLATTYNNLGTIFFNWTLFDRALDYYLHSLELQREIGNTNGIALSLCNIGLVFKETAQDERAIEYYKESLPYAKKSEQLKTLGYVLSCLGAAYEKTNQDSAYIFFKQSYDTYKKENNYDGEILALLGVGRYYLNTKNIEAAESHFTEMLALSQKENIAMRVAESYYYLGEISLRKNDFASAEKDLSKSIQLAEKINLKLVLRNSYLSLSGVYEKKGLLKEAVAALKSHNQFSDEIENEGMQKRLMDLKNKAEYEKYQRNLQLQKYENEKQKILLVGSMIVIVLLVLVAIVLVETNRRRKKTNQLLNEKNVLIEGQSSEIKEKNIELQDLNNAKEKLFSIIAHDLRSPFNTLINLTTMIKEDYNDLPDEQKLIYISHIEDTALKTYDLVENLLSLSTSRIGRLDYQPSEIELSSLAERVFTHIGNQAAEKSLTIHSEISQGLKVYGDKAMLEIVLRNLISNAIKYSHSGGVIEIKSKIKGENVNLMVRDYGIGMDKETQTNIFNSNIVHSKKGTRGEKGTGLGLGLCKEFIEKHCGTIWVESAPGQGSLFTFSVSQTSKYKSE